MKRIAVLLVCVMVISLIAGCAPAASSAVQESSSAVVEAPAASPTDMKAEITWWAFPTFASVDDTVGKYEQGVIDKFNAVYPNIKVNLETIDFAAGPEKITNAIQGKTAPDVLFDAPGRIIDYGNRGVLAPLDDLFTADMKSDVGNDILLQSCSNGTNYYMYPLSSAPFVMAVDGAVLEKEGLMDLINTKGDRTWTTEQYTKLNQELAKKGYRNAIVFCKDQGGDQGTRAFVANLYSSTMTKGDLSAWTINDDKGVMGLEYALKAVKAKELEAGIAFNGGDAIGEFAQGNVTATLLWSPGLVKARSSEMADNNVKHISLPLPSDNGKPNATEFLVNGFCVFNNGDDNKIAAAKEFVKFICDDSVVGKENVLQTNAFPVRKSFGNLYEGNEEMTFFASLQPYYGTYYNTIKGYSVARPEWWGNLQAATTGQKDAKTALNDFVKAGNDAIAAG